MKRRCMAMALILTLLLGLLPAAALADTQSTEKWCSASADGNHTWGNWMVRKLATCSEEGERYRVCRYCRFEQTERIKKEKHDYADWRIVRKATCSKACERVRKCRVCGHEDRQKIEKLPHTFGPWTVLKQPTCAETGSRQHTCKVCGETVQETIATLPHSWSRWETITAPTDHSAGISRRVCRICGAEETRKEEPEGTLHRGDKGDAVKRLQEGLICYGVLGKGGADGDFGPGTERAVRQVQEKEGLTQDGVAWPQTLAFTQHNFGEWKVISRLTRTTDGVRERTCLRCGLVERDVAEARPRILRGERGKRVDLIQNIIWDLGYDPGRIDGIYGPALDAAIVEWARDHDWYFEPGLLKPIDIDRIVSGWVEIDPDLIGVSGPNTPVSLHIEITPDFNMLDVLPGQSVKYNYTVTNQGTEDCTLGPLFISYGEDKGYRADEKRYRMSHIGDLSGEVLKAGGANSYTGSFTVSADLDKAELGDPSYKEYCIHLNAWVLGTSTVDKRRWYSNIDSVLLNIYPDESTLDENLALTARVLDAEARYTVGDEFEFEATLTNKTGKDLYVTIEGIGQTIDGALPITDEEKPVLLPAGETMTRTWPHRLCQEDKIRNGRYGFWVEAHGEDKGDGSTVTALPVSLWVNADDPYRLGSDALVLTRASDDAEGTLYHPGQTWRYRYRAANNGDVPLSDVRIRAYLCDYVDWIPLDEAEPGTLETGAHGDLEGELVVDGLYTTDDYSQDETGAWVRNWGYDVRIVAQGMTPDGEIVYAKPIKERIPVDFDDLDNPLPTIQCLELSAELVNPKDAFAEGESAEVKVTLKNAGDENLDDFFIEPFIHPDYDDSVWDEPGVIYGKTWLNAGYTWTNTLSIPLSCLWATEQYNLVLAAQGSTQRGRTVTSNSVTLPVTVLAGDGELEKQSLPIPDGISTIKSSGKKVPDGVLGETPAESTWRSLTVVKQTKDDDAYYDNAKIPVMMRLTIDDYDEYDFMGIEAAPGDSVSDESWMHGTLSPGMNYDFTYTMVLDPTQTGWKPRTVTAKLHSHSLDADEVESCVVRPPWTPAKVTLEDPNVHVINDNMSYLYLKLRSGQFKDNAYPGDIVDIPITVDSDGNTPISKVMFTCVEKLNGETVFAWSGLVRDHMNPGDKFNMWEFIRLKGTEVGQPKGYSLEMYLTGTIYNRKGKKEEIRSLPVEVPFTVLNPVGGKKILEFTSRLEPYKSSYAVNDQVDIHFTLQNNYREDLVNLRLNCLDGGEPFESLTNKAGLFNGDGSLKNGEKAEIVLHYTIKPEDIAKKQLVANFAVTGNPIGGDEIRSRRVLITIPVSDSNLPQNLTLSASCGATGAVKGGSEQHATLKVTNNADQRVVRVRVYAVGDNRYADNDDGVVWHDCGHGAKGWLCGECAYIEPGSSVELSNFFKVPMPYAGKDSFNAQWFVEADLADRSGTVCSNIATVSLELERAEEALDLTLTSYSPVQEVYDIGQNVSVSVLVENPGGIIPDDLEVVLTTESAKGSSYKGHITGTQGGRAYVTIGFTIDGADVVDGIWQGQIVALGYGGTVESVPLLFTLPVIAETEESPFDIELEVVQLTKCPNPDDYWYTGDKLQAQVTATYKGEGTPQDMVIQVLTPGKEEAWTTSASNTVQLKDVFETVLDASLAVNHVMIFEVSAWGSVEDPNVSDCFSETQMLIIPGLFNSPEEVSEGDPEDDGKQTQINWDAIHAAEAANAAEGKNTEATETGTPENDEKGTAAGGAETAAESDKNETPDGGSTSTGGESTSTGDESTSTGGGSASTGGGSTSTGSESASTGDGSASTGSGSASTGDGSVSTDGGSASTGGDTTTTDSGSASTGGSTSTGGGLASTGGSSISTGGDSASTGGSSMSTGGGSSESGSHSDEPTYSGTVDPNPTADACMYALAGQGADGATLCEKHTETGDAAAALTGAAPDDPKAWRQAEALWQEALNAEYDALLTDADAEAAAIIEAERTAFRKWLDKLRAEYDDPVYAEWTVCQQLATQVAALCELRQTAPEAPLGLPALNESLSPAEMPAQKTFDAWLGAHRALLALMYPNSPDCVNAILAVRAASL